MVLCSGHVDNQEQRSTTNDMMADATSMQSVRTMVRVSRPVAFDI